MAQPELADNKQKGHLQKMTFENSLDDYFFEIH